MFPISLMLLPFPFVAAERRASRGKAAKNPGRPLRVVSLPREVKPEVTRVSRLKPGAPSGATRRTRAAGPVPLLSRRELNRALLQRQFLMERTPLGVPEVVEHLVGLQAQASNPPYIGLWTRMARFELEDLTRLYTSRRVVRATLMRGTQHLVTARDFRGLRPMLQPVMDRAFQQSPYARALSGMELAEVVAEGRRLLAVEPLSNVELGRRLQARWPERNARALCFAVRNAESLVTVPPFGTWGVGGEVEFTRAETWLGGSMGPAFPEDEVVLRYLRAFGPASVKDVQTWSGLRGVAEVVARLGTRVRTFRDERGAELFDVPDAPRPDGDTPVPVRFLPEFDNVLLAYADRARIISEEHRRRVFTINGIVRATVLVDGFVRGMWRVEREKTRATLCIEPFASISRADRVALTDEGLRLLACVASSVPTHDVRFARVS